MALQPSEDNGGAALDAYELWIDDGELGPFSKLTSYDGQSTSFTIDNTVEPQLISGKIYRAKYLAHNEMGDSEFSETVSAAMADLPGEPLAPVKNLGLSTETKIVIDWTAVADTQEPGGAITFYKVFMDSRTSGDFRLVHYASSSLTQIAVDGLERGVGYRFKIQAENINGVGPESPVGLMYACTVPKDLVAPYIVATSSTSMTLEWAAPTDDGGCPTTGYALFRDDGTSAVPNIEVNTADDPGVRNIPTLRRTVAEFDVADLGT